MMHEAAYLMSTLFSRQTRAVITTNAPVLISIDALDSPTKRTGKHQSWSGLQYLPSWGTMDGGIELEGKLLRGRDSGSTRRWDPAVTT
jgi:hypothetical protein